MLSDWAWDGKRMQHDALRCVGLAAMPLAYTVSSLAQGTEPSEADIKKLIRKGTIGGNFVPVLCGSAFKNKGVQVSE